jgi:hypothetical protein
MSRNIAAVALLVFGLACRPLVAQEEDSIEERDTSAGLPKQYADKYLIASSTISPDKKMAVIYPKEDDEKGKDYLVALKPFHILGTLETPDPYFAHRSHGGISAEWSQDNSVALVTLESKWGPGDVFVYEIHDGKLTRSTNLLSKIHDLLKPDCDKVKPDAYNDSYQFIFDDGTAAGDQGDSAEPIKQCILDGTARVKIKAGATTDPKHIPGIKAWDAKFDGTWDIAQAKFTSSKVTRIFGGKRKDD